MNLARPGTIALVSRLGVAALSAQGAIVALGACRLAAQEPAPAASSSEALRFSIDVLVPMPPASLQALTFTDSAFVDLDVDGDLDIVAIKSARPSPGRSAGASRLESFLQGSDRLFAPSTNPWRPDHLVVGCDGADMDLDGDTDLLAFGADGAVTVLRNAAGRLESIAHKAAEPGATGGQALWCDVNGDRLPDLVRLFVAPNWSVGGEGFRFAGERPLVALDAPSPALAGSVCQAQAIDADADGDLDLAFCEWWGCCVRLLQNTDPGSRGLGLEMSPNQSAMDLEDVGQSEVTSFRFANLDGDAQPELIMGRWGPRVDLRQPELVLDRQADDRWQVLPTALGPDPPRIETTRIEVADFGADGDNDFFALGSDGYSYVALNDGLARFTCQELFTEGEACSLGDVDGDGGIDVLVAGRAATLFRSIRR